MTCPIVKLVVDPVMNKNEYVETVPCVHIGGGQWVPTDKVVFVDISEDIQGHDIMTFIYEGKEMQSRIRSYPS